MPLAYSTATTTSISADVVWRVWTSGTSATTIVTDTASSTGPIWSNWVTTASTSATSTTTDSVVWDTWIREQGIAISDVRPRGQPIRSAWNTEEARAERARREEAYRRQREAEERARVLAEERATQLLVSVLDEQQRRDFAAHGHFFVDAPSGRRYRIDKGRSGNVKVIDRTTGVWVESLCIHQRDMVPVPDTMVMQKLLIETAEDEFRAVANITRRDGGMGYGRGVLDGERLARVIPFPGRERAREAA